MNELNELTEEQKSFCQGIGKEFIKLLENTNMTKVYKMPVLMAFYNHGDIRMGVTETELLASWKEFFSTGTNWKDWIQGLHMSSIARSRIKIILKRLLRCL